jgi:endonuclease-3 related protein
MPQGMLCTKDINNYTLLRATVKGILLNLSVFSANNFASAFISAIIFMCMPSEQLKKIYDLLYARFGPQHWWPGDTPFEVIVGAVLTQNTNWGNVERAIVNLKKAKILTPEKLHSIKSAELAKLIRPAGYFNIKASRLKNLIGWLFINYAGKLAKLKTIPTHQLRGQLLGVSGVGPETADSILLYAFNRPVFVVDAYTKRIFSRHHLIKLNAEYEQISAIFESNLPSDVKLFNEYHALLVRTGKEFCKPTPLCAGCPLNLLPHQM